MLQPRYKGACKLIGALYPVDISQTFSKAFVASKMKKKFMGYIQGWLYRVRFESCLNLFLCYHVGFMSCLNRVWSKCCSTHTTIHLKYLLLVSYHLGFMLGFVVCISLILCLAEFTHPIRCTDHPLLPQSCSSPIFFCFFLGK